MSPARPKRSVVGRPFAFGDVLNESFKIVARRFLTLVAIMMAVSLPLLIIVGIAEANPQLLGQELTLLIGGSFLAISGLILQPVAVAAATKVVAGELTGKSVGVGNALGFGLSRFLPVLGVTLSVALAFGVGFILIIPGIIFYVWFYTSVPVVVVEQKGVFAAMVRSRELVRGNGWGVFALLVVLLVIALVFSVLLLFLLSVFGLFSFDPMANRDHLVLGQIPQHLMSVVMQTVGITAPVVTYFHLRGRMDGVEAKQIAALVDQIGDSDGGR